MAVGSTNASPSVFDWVELYERTFLNFCIKERMPTCRTGAKLLSKDEARRIAVNIAKGRNEIR